MIEHKPTGPVDQISYAFSRVTMWGAAFIVAIMFYEVVMRYVFFQPTLWVNEMSLWAGGMIYATAGLYAMQQRSHIRIYVLYDMAPLWLRQVFDVISVLCTSIFVFAVLWGGFGEAAAKFARWEVFGTAWDPPIPATDKPLMLIALLFLFLQAISNLIRDWPAAPWVRKAFDVVSGALVIFLCVWSFPGLFSTDPEFAVPTSWRILIGALMVAAIGYVLRGWWKDFNTTPVPFDENRDPSQEFDLPAEITAGRSTQN